MRLFRLVALLLVLLSTPMFLVGVLYGSAVLWAGSFVVWGLGLAGVAVCRFAGNAEE